MGATKAEFDRGKIQDEVLKLIDDGKFSNDNAGLRAATRDVAAKRVAVASRLESLIRDKGIPARLASKFAETVLDDAVAVIDDLSIPDGEAVAAKFNELVATSFKRGQHLFDREGIAAGTEFDGKKLITEMFGEDALQTEGAQKALELLKSKLDKAKDEKIDMDAFKAKCAHALDLAVRTYALRMMGKEMMLETSENPSYGRAGIRLYDALGVGNGPNERAIDDYYFWKMDPSGMVTKFDIEGKDPDGLRREARKMVLQAIAVDYAGKLPKLPNEHPHLMTAKIATANAVSRDFVDRFESAATVEDFAKLAEDLKARLAVAVENVNASLKQIDLAIDEAKGELEERLGQMAGQYGFPVTKRMNDMVSSLISDARTSLQKAAPESDKPLSLEECKAAILARAEKKWLAPCRQAAGEIAASQLDPAQKKAFIAKVLENNFNVVHARIARKVASAFNSAEMIAAAKAGDGRKLAEQLHRFILTMNKQIKEREELDSIKGSEDYSACVTTSAELLFITNPDLLEGIRGLDAGSREKLFDDSADFSTAKSVEIQNQKRYTKNAAKSQAMGTEANYWAMATTCAVILQQQVR